VYLGAKKALYKYSSFPFLYPDRNQQFVVGMIAKRAGFNPEANNEGSVDDESDESK